MGFSLEGTPGVPEADADAELDLEPVVAVVAVVAGPWGVLVLLVEWAAEGVGPLVLSSSTSIMLA